MIDIVSTITDYIDSNTTNTKAVDLFIDNLPDTIDNGIMLIGIGGDLEKQYDLFEQKIEIWTRNKVTSDGFSKLGEILTLLHRKANISIDNAYIYFIQSTTNVESMGRDINGRSLHKIIVRVIYKDQPGIS